MESVESPVSSEGGANRSFWAIELQPGKEFTTSPDFDLHVTQAVLPAAAKDKERTVVSVKIDEEDAEKKPIAIAALRIDHAESQNIDLVFDANETVTFSVSGKNPVHLSGYLIPPAGAESGDEFDYDDEEIDEDEFGSEQEGSEEDVDEDEIKAQIEAAGKRKALAQNGAPAQKKAKQDQPKAAAAPQQKPQQAKPQDTPKSEGKKPQQQQQQQKSPAQPQQKAPQTKKFENGLEVTTLKEGTGRVAKNGDKAFVKYIGKLTKGGKVFDKSLDKPFPFALGRHEVIAGWDLGVVGMKIGEKRKLVIPSALGYGARGAKPEIPGNASLTFEVELVRLQ